jgi:hypothetical protein
MIDNTTVLFEDSPLTALPGIVLGYRENGKAIYNIAGGAADVVATDDSDDADEDDDSDDEEDTEDTWAPPTKEEWEKTLALKAKADSESAARKRFLRAAGFDPKTGEKVNKPSIQLEDVDETDTDDAKPEAKKKDEPGFDREKFEKQFQRQLDREVSKAERSGRATAYSLIHEVPNALEDAGWNGKNLPRMIKLLDLDALSIDQDGIDPDELNGQVAELKRDFPEFFKRSRMREAAKEVADTKAVGGGKKQAPASEEDLDWKTRMKLQLQQGK